MVIIIFKSTNEYNNAIHETLIYIRDNNSFPETNDKLNKIDLGDVLNLCYNHGYVDGVHIEKNAVGNYLYNGQPRITYSGLQFIENFNK